MDIELILNSKKSMKIVALCESRKKELFITEEALMFNHEVTANVCNKFKIGDLKVKHVMMKCLKIEFLIIIFIFVY